MDLIRSSRWTIGLSAALLLLNLGKCPEASASLLQYDRDAINRGEVWRLLTGNLVHWGTEHFLLDVGALLVVGLLFERFLGRWYPLLLLGTAAAVGLSLWLFLPELAIYRGLSGVDSGQFAAALVIEISLARWQPERWLWAVPALLIFAVKIGFECTTGQMFFGTESLGNLGMPTPLAHGAGAVVGTLLAMVWSNQSESTCSRMGLKAESAVS